MKQLIFGLWASFFILNLAPSSLLAQAKKPTAMVVPSEIYLTRKGFFTEIEVNGQKKRVFDYQRMFQEDSDVRAIITSINGFMIKEQFPLKDLEQVLKGLVTTEVEAEVMRDKNGNALQESNLDRVKKTAKADIILDIDFELKRNGPERYVTINLRGNDGYTNKTVTTCQIVGKGSVSASLDVLLLENNYACMTAFVADLQSHFTDLQTNGREATLRFQVAEGASTNLETEFGDKELSEVFENWLDELCVQSRYSVTDATETFMSVEQARVPLFDKANKAMDTREFMQIFRKRLKEPPYNLSCRVSTRGLGEAWLIIGGPK